MAATPPQVKVTIHPNGTLELHHAAPGAKFQTYKGDLNATDGGPKLPANQLGFAAGKGYYKKPAPTAALPPRKPVVAPAAPLTIQQQAQAILDPVSKSITDAINARVQAQQTAIGGYSKDLAGLMGQYAPASKQIYGEAQAGQAATDAALGQTLTGQGQSGQAELAANLAKISADPATAARINATSGANLAGASGAMAAKGAASLSDLIARGASAQDYGAKQPGIAGLYGLQATKAAQSQATTDTANAVGQLEQKLPDVIQQLKGDQQAAALNKQQQASNETSRAVAATQLLGSAPPWAAKILGIKPGASTEAAVSAANSANAKVTAASTAAAAKVTAASVAAAAKTSAPKKVNTTLSAANGYLTDGSGNAILKGGKQQPYTPAPSKSTVDKKATHGLTQQAYQSAVSKAQSLAAIAHTPTSDGHPPVSWLTYLRGAQKQGLPTWVIIQEGRKVYSEAERKNGLIPKG